MRNEQTKIRHRKRKCRNCGELYKPDPRAKKKQKYCSADECRKASQTASWKRWRQKPENRDYYKGEDQVDRTRAWRHINPGYWKRWSIKKNALPNEITSQVPDMQEDSSCLASGALPNEILLQSALIAGLISTLTGSALPKDIAESSRLFILLGHDILGIGSGINSKGGYDDDKTCYMSAANAACAETV